MQYHLSRTLLLGLIFTLAPMTMAAEQAKEKPGRISATIDTMTATVIAIDHKTREVTLKGPKGRTIELTVGPEAKNLGQVKKGDEVTVDYIESVAIVVSAASAEVPTDNAAAYVETAKPGEKPHAKAVKTMTITATVEAIDYQKRRVTLKGPEGNVRTITVGPEVKRLEQVKKGDQVTVRVTVATAISVSTPAGKK